ncbi:MAG: fumarate reductase cytochrome b subunit [Desulfamplus sp.]|nr:fumarate reductase cytochrome b subunit [Desulfamplus sp.]MBF0258530.1 fumarate reductase cytochrome b subunit [Desulfamplus sp.]
MESLIINDKIKKSRIPARLDLLQSGTGLILGLFMWVHMMLVGSIVLGKDAFNFVAKTMELSFLSSTGHGYPAAVFFAVLGVFTLFIIHAALGVRKFPISWKQHEIFRSQMGMMKHEDTNLWYIQVITAFIMFFLGSAHLFVMLTNPGQIDPYLSADRVISHNMWPLYLILLFAVELHGTIGLYRLCMKWGWFDKVRWFNENNRPGSRQYLKMLKKRLTIFFLALGLLALLVFSVIGIRHKDRVGERYNSGHSTVQTSVSVKTEALSEDNIDNAAMAEAISEENTDSTDAASVEKSTTTEEKAE